MAFLSQPSPEDHKRLEAYVSMFTEQIVSLPITEVDVATQALLFSAMYIWSQGSATQEQVMTVCKAAAETFIKNRGN